MFIYTSDFTFRLMTNGVIPLFNYRHLLMGDGWICKHLHGCRCHTSHPRGLSTGRKSTPPATQQLTPEVTLLDSSHNPLGKKGVSEECGRPLRQPLITLHPQTHSTHWTHQVISWELRYLLANICLCCLTRHHSSKTRA